MKSAAADNDWTGFEPTGYEINWKLLSDAPLVELRDGSERVPTTAGAILREALPHLFTPINEDGTVGTTPARQKSQVDEGIAGGVTIKTPDRTIRLDTLGNGSSFVADIVATLIRIDQASEHRSFHPIFFYYDRDHVVDDVHDSFSFFVVNDDRFVLDRVTFSRHSGSGFDRRVFDPFYTVKNQIWRSEPYVEDAKVRWWYRRFYEETDAGKLTTLRDDVDLFHYVPDWKQRAAIAMAIGQIAATTKQVQRLLVYLLVIAIAMIIVWLWR